MEIIIKDKSTGAVKVPVRIVKKLKDMTADEAIKAFDMFNVLIDYHYSTCDEYKNTDDVASDEMIEYISEVLYDEYKDDDFDYETLAKQIMDKLEDKLIDEIEYRDENARAE